MNSCGTQVDCSNIHQPVDFIHSFAGARRRSDFIARPHSAVDGSIGRGGHRNGSTDGRTDCVVGLWNRDAIGADSEVETPGLPLVVDRLGRGGRWQPARQR